MRTHLLDLMELPSIQRRLIQLLLRRGTLLETELRRMIALLPEGESLTPAQFDSMLESLEHAGWMTRNTDGDEIRWRVRFAPKPSKGDDPIWERLSLESIRQQWHVRLPALSGLKPSDKPPEELLKGDLMRRGGKRTLSNAIWDKLEDEPTPESEAKSRVGGLLDALEKPKEKPSSDKKDIRKKLWDAFGDDE